MLADALPYLRCPQCGADLRHAATTLHCPAGHSFDIARQGYVSLLTGAPRAGTGDTAAMIAARHSFLTAGHYSPIACALEAAARAHAGDGCVLDLGAGTGYYLAGVLDSLPGRTGLALDVSRYALRRAARAHPSIAAIGADTWQPLPVRSGTVGLALNVFAPRNTVELRRTLAPHATLLMVTPTAAHLRELVSTLDLVGVDPDKEHRLARSVGNDLTLAASTRHEFDLRLTHADVATVVGMGPSARHLTPAQLTTRIDALPEPMQVTVSVTLSAYRA